MAFLVNEGEPDDRQAIRLATRQNTWIPNIRRQPRPPGSMSAALAMLMAAHRQWKNRSLDSVYNCMGMVFGARRTCIDPDQFGLIVKEDGYRQLAGAEEPVPGDIIVYRKGTGEVAHIGLLVEVHRDLIAAIWKMRVLSQFGFDGEYFHDADDLPAMLDFSRRLTSELWTDRK